MKKILPENISASTPAMSGWICEHIWSFIECTGLLTTFTYAFEVHEVPLLHQAGVSFETSTSLPIFKHIMFRLISGILLTLRRWAAVTCTQEEADENPGYLDMVNKQIADERRCYKADMMAAAQMEEMFFPVSALSTNLYFAVTRVPCEMERHGACRPELGVEREVDYNDMSDTSLLLVTFAFTC